VSLPSNSTSPLKTVRSPGLIPPEYVPLMPVNSCVPDAQGGEARLTRFLA
jgi:hypothetical protein